MQKLTHSDASTRKIHHIGAFSSARPSVTKKREVQLLKKDSQSKKSSNSLRIPPELRTVCPRLRAADYFMLVHTEIDRITKEISD